MAQRLPVRTKDLRGVARLSIDAIMGVTDLVEAMHHTIINPHIKTPAGAVARTRGVSGFVYRSVRGITHLVGGGIDMALRGLQPLLGDAAHSTEREAVLAALNGVLGDHLAATGNPLAIPMQFKSGGMPLTLDAAAISAAIPQVNGRVLVLAHGLCMNDQQWLRKEHDHGASLAQEFGWTPVYLHYNTGRHISSNGRDFAVALESLLAAWPVPVEELVILGHSMGGLVARSAYHHGEQAGQSWIRHLSAFVFLGSPHHGAPLERGGNWIDIILGANRYSAPFSRLGKIRSAGITDLRHGNLRDTDWSDHDRFARGPDRRLPLPLPPDIPAFTVAASMAQKPGSRAEEILGDGLVPLASALGRHKNVAFDLQIPTERQWVGYGMNHLDLLNRPEVYTCLQQWLGRDLLSKR